MFERFTVRARQVVVLAQDEARLLRDGFIGTEHLLLGLLREEGAAARILGANGVGLDDARALLRRGRSAADPAQTGQMPFTSAAKGSLEAGVAAATALGANEVRPEHLLLGLVERADGVGAEILAVASIDREKVIAGLSQDERSEEPGLEPPGARFALVPLEGPPGSWPAQLEAQCGRLVTIVPAGRVHHAVFQRRP